jgi:hypothetical protein
MEFVMSGGLFNTSSRLALALAAGLVLGTVNVTSANAADLGGDCCADLEERVAELEASAVKHANRKVTLTIGGRVNEAVMYWNDGQASDIYVVEPDVTRNRIGFSGTGKVDSNLSIGYNMTIRFSIGRGRAQQQNYVAPNGLVPGANGVVAATAVSESTPEFETETVFFQDKRFGKLEMGFRSSGFRDLLDGGFDLGGGTSTLAKSGISEWVSNFNVGNGRLWSEVLGNQQVGRTMQVRYDTPAISGFTLSASWGDDDTVSANLAFDQKFGETQVRAGVGYYLSRLGAGTAFEDANREQYAAGLSLYNSPSGLFFTGLYGVRLGQAVSATVRAEDSEFFWVKGGWRNKINPYGQTAIYAEYGESTNNRTALNATRTGTDGAGGEMWGVGVTQDIDPVGATAYLQYRNHSINDEGPNAGVAGCGPTALAASRCDALDVIMGGMIVNF